MARRVKIGYYNGSRGRVRVTTNDMDWLQFGAFVIAVLGLGLAGLVYFTRQLNRQFDAIDKRFDLVDARFDRIDARFDRNDVRFDRNDARFDRIDARFDRIDARMTRIEERIGRLEQWQASADERFDRIDARFDRMDARFDRIEKRLGEMEQTQIRFDERLVRVEELQTANRSDLKSLNDNVQNLEKEQARMLGFLEGRGVMGKAPPEPATEARQ